MNDNSILDKYLNEIGGTTLLTDEEEQALALRIENGDEGAIGEIVSANLRYVVTIARQYERQGLSNEDLISEGNIGLMKAAARYSTRTGKRFVVFAAPFTRQAIELAIEKQTGLYRIPKGESTAAERKQSHALSFDEPIPVGSKNNFSLLNVVEDKDAVRADELTEKKGLSEELAQHIGILPEREQEVIKSVFGIGRSHLTMAETGAEMGLKRERVRQIRDKALRKLRKACITNQ